MGKQWKLYILQCADGTLYTGITDDLQRRLEAHRIGRGAKYTRGRGPLTLCYTEECEDRSHALRREIQIKKLSRQEKLMLCATYRTEKDNENEAILGNGRNN